MPIKFLDRITSHASQRIESLVVPGTGIEPARCCHHQILSLARLPIPPSGQRTKGLQIYTNPPSRQVLWSGFHDLRSDASSNSSSISNTRMSF